MVKLGMEESRGQNAVCVFSSSLLFNQCVSYCEPAVYMCVIACISINCVTTFFPSQGLVAGTVIVGILILVKIFWDYGKSG